MNIAILGEESFKYGIAVLFRSMAECTTAAEIRFMVLDLNLQADTREKFIQTVAALPVKSTIEFLQIQDSKIYQALLSHQRDSKRRSFREQCWMAKFVLPELLSKSMDYVLYMDSDIYCNRDVAEIEGLLAGAPIAAVQDGPARDLGYTEEYKIAGLDPKAPFFNSGVMAFNLAYWRENDMSNETISVAKKYFPSFPEQSLFNMLFFGKWKELAWEFNYQCPFRYGILNEVRDGKKINAHCLTNPKPWQVGECPETQFFYDALDRTAFRGWRANPIYWALHGKLRWLKYVLTKRFSKTNEEKAA